MRKIILVSFLILASYYIKAQDGRTTFGFKAGICNPQLYGSDVNNLSNAGNSIGQKGFYGGINVNSRIGTYFWLKHEVFYAIKNITLKINDNVNPAYQSAFNRQMIDLFPISVTFHFKGVQLFAGPYMGILLTATKERKDSTGNMITDNIFGNPNQNSNYAQKVDYGFVIGMEYELKFGLNIGARYVQGFSSVFENANSFQSNINSSSGNENIYNRYIAFTIGYSFVSNSKDKK